MDLAGIAILIGVLMALFRRIVLRPETLETRWDDYLALTLLGLIPIVGFTTEAARLVATTPAWSAWSPVGNAIANLLRSLGLTSEQAFLLHRFLLWPHVGLALALVASIPFTKMRHLFATPLSVLNRPLRKPGTLEKIENMEETEQLGVGKVEEFTSWQLLSFDACVRCRQQFKGIIDRGVAEQNLEARGAIYHEFNQLYFEQAPVILMYQSINRQYQQR